MQHRSCPGSDAALSFPAEEDRGQHRVHKGQAKTPRHLRIYQGREAQEPDHS